MPTIVAQAAPDRPRDLHPLQHLRSDLPGAARSRTTRATTSSTPTSATSAWPASRRARPARSTTGARCRGAQAYTVEEQLGWDELPAELTPEQLAPKAWRAGRSAGAGRAPPRRQRRAGRGGVQQRRTTAPRCRPGRPRMPTPTSTARRRRKTVTATVVGNCPRHRGRHASTTPTTSCSTSAPCRSRCSKASRSASCRRAPTPAGAPHHRAPVLDRQPAQRRAAGLQQRLADHQARARGPPGQAGARRRQQLHVRPEGRRQGAGDRPVRHQLPDAQPPAIAHRDDLHRHRQRADARDDRMAAPPARSRASSKAAS